MFELFEKVTKIENVAAAMQLNRSIRVNMTCRTKIEFNLVKLYYPHAVFVYECVYECISFCTWCLCYGGVVRETIVRKIHNDGIVLQRT